MDKKVLSKQVKIEDLLPHKKDLKVIGFKYLTHCPFHDDEHAMNFYIYRATNSWYCFVCREGGDSIRFYEKLHNVDFKEAIKSLSSINHGRK